MLSGLPVSLLVWLVLQGTHQEISIPETVESLTSAGKVLIVPGYGLAVANAQHSIAELTKMLKKKGVEVEFGIHPVAGRMPGQLNVLLAEAGVPYDVVFEMDEVNQHMETYDVVVVSRERLLLVLLVVGLGSIAAAAGSLLRVSGSCPGVPVEALRARAPCAF